jgi:hypothetical protein
MRMLALVLLVLAMRPANAAGAEHVLTVDEPSWRRVVFLDGRYKGITAGDAALFRIEDDPVQGRCLAVGPWIAGQWAARFEYASRIPLAAGTLRGVYRTDGLLPTQTAVTVIYHAGERRIEKRRYRLEPAPDWRAFEVVFRNPPAGADSVVVAVGLDELAAGTARFANLTVGSDAAPLLFADTPPPLVRSRPGVTLAPARRFRLRQLRGAWWLVTPEGAPFYSIGTVAPALDGGDPLAQGLALANLIRHRGFNSLAGWTHLRSWARVNRALADAGLDALPLFAVVDTKLIPQTFGRLVDCSGYPVPGGGFPDPFDPAFALAYGAAVREALGIVGDAPWFAGWFADSELPHADLSRYVYSPHASRAFLSFLRARHATIAALNAAWGTSFAGFGAILAERPDPVAGPEPLRRDFVDFERVLVGRYVDVTLACLRAADPGRLVFSNRFAAGVTTTLDRVLDLYARYDGIGVNLYPGNTQPGLSPDETAFLRFVAERTGRPLLIAEWSVPAVDSGLYDPPAALDWSWNDAVATQGQRAAQADALTRAFYELPFVVGAHWFTWKDFDTDRRRANRGLFTAAGAPWKALQFRLREANGAVALH